MLIEIAYGLREKQYLYAYEVEEGTTVTEAIEASPLKKNLPDLVIDKVGIFSKPVTMDRILKEGDRIEVYRPLKIDPRKNRRKKVEKERQKY